MVELALLVVGGALLYFGAEWFVSGASALALALRVPQLIIGLTVVAYGTSTPEIVVSLEAALAGHADVALGNVLGSNIANIGLILGLAALVRPALVDGALSRRELPVLLASTAVVPLLLVDGAISRLEAAGLVAVAVGYTLWMVRVARASASVAAATTNAQATEEAAQAAGGPKSKSVVKAALVASLGLGVLVGGGNLFVRGAVGGAQLLGMSERLVGLTIVAVGTSLPELVTSLLAARRGHSDLAVGNVVGSNIFNVFLCLGGSALAGPVRAPLASLWLDLGGLVVMTLLAAVFIRRPRTISRVEGAVALSAYACFIALSIARG